MLQFQLLTIVQLVEMIGLSFRLPACLQKSKIVQTLTLTERGMQGGGSTVYLGSSQIEH